jgi:DNA invertase Pin-like site-specific DNA recombinase
MTIFGYAHGSTGDTVAAQVAELRAAGCAEVYYEQASGAKRDRPELTKALQKLEPGDVFVVTRLDRLARSKSDLLKTLCTLAERNVGFKSIGDAWADTTSPHRCVVLAVLSGLAELERELNKARITRAKARGVRLGRQLPSAQASARSLGRWRDTSRSGADLQRGSQHDWTPS